MNTARYVITSVETLNLLNYHFYHNYYDLLRDRIDRSLTLRHCYPEFAWANRSLSHVFVAVLPLSSALNLIPPLSPLPFHPLSLIIFCPCDSASVLVNLHPYKSQTLGLRLISFSSRNKPDGGLVAQAVRRSPPTAGIPSSRLGHFMWVSWWTKRGLGRFFSGFLPFSPTTNFIPPFLHSHLIHFVSFHPPL